MEETDLVIGIALATPAIGFAAGEPNPSSAVSDGFWVLAPPLADGEQVIEFGGTPVLPDFTFVQKAA